MDKDTVPPSIPRESGETGRSSHRHHRSKSPLFTLSSENHGLTESKYHQLEVAEVICGLLAVVGFACAAVTYDLEYAGSVREDKENTLAVVIGTGNVSTLLLVLSVVWRRYREVKWEQARCVLAESDRLYSSGKYKGLLLEIGLNLPHPLWWLRASTFSSYIAALDTTVEYGCNAMLTVCTVVRVYHVLRAVCAGSKFRTGRAQRVCQVNGCEAGNWFAIRCLMEDSPAYMLGVLFFGGIFLGAWLMRIFERPTSSQTGIDFSSYENAFWQVLVTMTTVGYGDYYPVTHPGRIVTILVCGWGVVLISLVVLVLTEQLALVTGEKDARNIMVRLDFKEEMKDVAAGVLGSAYRCRRCIVGNKQEEKSLKVALGTLRKRINSFHSMQIQKRTLYEVDSFEEKLERDLRTLGEFTQQSLAQLADIKGLAREAELLL